MKGKLYLFFCWAGLLALALYFAYLTGNMQDAGREQVATIRSVSGQVYQRPENLSVYELILANDRVFNNDYISTGAGASAEIELLSSKTLHIGENSLIQLSFGSDAAGFGSDIVTLLKGDVVARGTAKGAPSQRPKKLSFNVGKNSVKDIEDGAGVKISKKVEEVAATITVVAGTARIVGGDNKVQEVKTNEVVKVTSEPKVEKIAVAAPAVNLAKLSVPIITAAPENIAFNDKLIKEVPRTIRNLNLASLKPIENNVEPSPSFKKEVLPEPVKEEPVKKEPVKPEPVKKAPVVNKKAGNPVAVAATKASVPEKSEDPYKVTLFSTSPAAFKGDGIYVVKNHRLFAKITGKPTTAHLLSVLKKYDGEILYKGNAEALSGAVKMKTFQQKNTVFAVNGNGIERIDATLVRTRPAAVELLRKGGYSIFTEKVNVLNVGH